MNSAIVPRRRLLRMHQASVGRECDQGYNKHEVVTAMKNPEATIHIKDMDPVTVQCDENDSETVSMLLTALNLNKSNEEDEVMYLNLGGDRDQSLFFLRSRLLSVQLAPGPGEEVLRQVEQNLANIEKVKAASRFNDGWRQWIWSHLGHGISKDTIFQILVNHGFPAKSIEKELNHEFCAANVDHAMVARVTGAQGSRVFLPNAERKETIHAEIYTLENFLTNEECEHVLALMEGSLEPSRVFAEQQVNEARTSQTCFFRDRENRQAYVRVIEERACRLLGIHPSHLECIQGQYYEVGQEYQPHADFFSPGTREYEENCGEGAQGQRTWTVLIYLKDDFEGGQTCFNNLGFEIQPKRGMALIWNNLQPSGDPNPYTLHQAKPVEKGTKAIVNIWFRERGDGSEMWIKPDQEYIRNYTRDGIAIADTPPDLFEKIRAYYEENKENESRITKEEPNQHLNKGDAELPPSEVISMTEELRSLIHEELKPHLEKWSGQTLEPTAIYGIRKYFEGAHLEPHYDWSETHVISAILCVDMNEGQEWPLQIDDNFYRRHQVVMKPGQMLLYESARLLHGRPTPLDSGYHCNLYVHYRPVNHEVPESLRS